MDVFPECFIPTSIMVPLCFMLQTILFFSLELKRNPRYSFLMATVSLVFLSFIPCIVWFAFCLTKGYAAVYHLFFFSVAATVAVFLSVLVRLALEPLGGLVPVVLSAPFTALVLTAFPEEISKLLAILPFAHNALQGEAVSVKRLCARAVCIALAFASLENIVFGSRLSGSLTARYFTAVPLHGATALLSAMWLSHRLAGTHSPAGVREKRFFMLSAAILCHAVYAWGFEVRPPLFIVSALAALIAVIRAVYLWQTCGENDAEQ